MRAAQDPRPQTLRQLAATTKRLLAELYRAAEHDLQLRSAGADERERVAAELEGLRLEEEALLERVARLEALAADPDPEAPHSPGAATGPRPAAGP
jgi:hypothetical protein